MTARERANAVCIQTLNAGDEELAKAIEVALMEARRDESAKWRRACDLSIRCFLIDDCEVCPHGGRTHSCPECCIERVRKETIDFAAKTVEEKLRAIGLNSRNDTAAYWVTRAITEIRATNG